MIRKNNRQCICCEKEYVYCPNCSDFAHMPSWMTIYHDNNCKEICDAIKSYGFNYITKEQAKDLLDKCDLTNKKMFKQSIQNKIDEIYTETNRNVMEDIEIKEAANLKKEFVSITEAEEAEKVVECVNDEIDVKKTNDEEEVFVNESDNIEIMHAVDLEKNDTTMEAIKPKRKNKNRNKNNE